MNHLKRKRKQLQKYRVNLQRKNYPQRSLQLKSNNIEEVVKELTRLCTAGEKCVIISTSSEIFNTGYEEDDTNNSIGSSNN
jgi:sugar-specific transcriptional regulator TrmB